MYRTVNSAVGVVIRLSVDNKGILFRIPASAKVFLPRNLQTRSVVHQVFCATRSGKWPGHDVDRSPPNSKAKNKWSCSSIYSVQRDSFLTVTQTGNICKISLPREIATKSLALLSNVINKQVTRYSPVTQRG
jgi:hypothetical protein